MRNIIIETETSGSSAAIMVSLFLDPNSVVRENMLVVTLNTY